MGAPRHEKKGTSAPLRGGVLSTPCRFCKYSIELRKNGTLVRHFLGVGPGRVRCEGGEAPSRAPRVPYSREQRLAAFVAKTIPEPMSGCTLWLGKQDSSGYGQEPMSGCWLWLAYVDKCDNPPCVNPDHLFLGTNLDNIQDRKRKRRGRGFAGGIGNPSAKLTPEMVMAILAESAAGATARDLARKYGVHESTAGRIVRRQLWKERPQ